MFDIQHSSFDEALKIPVLTIQDIKNGGEVQNVMLKSCLGPFNIK